MSTRWLDRARLEIPQSAGEGTAVTAERNLTTVMAVPQPGKSEISHADEIHQAVLLMAAHWQYTPDDLAYVLTDSASDPQGWLPILYAEGWLVKPTETTRATP